MRDYIHQAGVLCGIGLLALSGCVSMPESQTQEPVIIEMPSSCDCGREETGMVPVPTPVPTPIPIPIATPVAGEPLNTYMFERDALRLHDVSDASLEAFMQDLNRRKDHAIACMDGGASADSEYLWFWITRVCDELQSRGYRFDHGAIFRDGREVALR